MEKRESGRRLASTGRSQARAVTTICSSGGKRPRATGAGSVGEGPALGGPAAPPFVDGLVVQPAQSANLGVRAVGMGRQGQGELGAPDFALGRGVLGDD